MITLAQLLVSHKRPVTSADVIKAVGSLPSPATSTLDKISLYLLKLSLPAIAAPIATIFYLSIRTGVFLSSWKIGQVVPVHKKGNRAYYANYRPITLLPLLSMVMEHVVHEQLKCCLEEHHTIDSAQYGFCSKRLCCSALLALSNNLLIAKNAGLFSAVAALDYTRAFDTIYYSLLLNKLGQIGFDKIAVAWFSSYLLQRQQYTCATMAWRRT